MYNWADQFNTYEDACVYYGADTPAQIEAELRYEREEACVAEQDDLEARGAAGPGSYLLTLAAERALLLDDIPF